MIQIVQPRQQTDTCEHFCQEKLDTRIDRFRQVDSSVSSALGLHSKGKTLLWEVNILCSASYLSI